MSEESATLVSVVVNCHNSEKFIEECIASIIAQTYKNFEIIVWDNKSNDLTESILRRLSFSDGRIKYFRGANFVPLGAARNRALTMCSGSWIAFLDSDDLWDHNFLTEQMGALHGKERSAFGFGFVTEFIEDSKSLENRPSKNRTLLSERSIFEKLLTGNFIYFSSLVFSRDALEFLKNFDSSYVQAEDYELLLRLAGKFKAVQVGEVFYRLHENNLSKTQSQELYVENLDILMRYLSFRVAKISFSFNFAQLAIYCLKLKKFNVLIQIIKSKKYKIIYLILGLFIISVYNILRLLKVKGKKN
jgi:glycosyltransferase involved in cell wall biosynthesis